MDSNTLLHFLMTSRSPRKVVSSLSAPRVAVSMATSSTSARSCERVWVIVGVFYSYFDEVVSF